MLPLLHLGPLTLKTDLLILIIALWGGFSLLDIKSMRLAISASHLSSILMIVLTFVIIGARVGYIIQYPSAFLNNPLNILSLNPALFHTGFGLVSGFLAGWIYIQRKELNPWDTLDGLTLTIAVLLSAIPLALSANGSLYGSPTQFILRVTYLGAARHPAGIYLTLASFLLFVLLLRAKENLLARGSGIFFLSFSFWSGLIYLVFGAFIGSMQGNTSTYSPILIGAWVISALSAWLLIRTGKRNIGDETKA